MVEILTNKACSIIKFIDTRGLFIILAFFLIGFLFTNNPSKHSSDNSIIFIGILYWLVYSTLLLYQIALLGLRQILTKAKLVYNLFNFLFLTGYWIALPFVFSVDSDRSNHVSAQHIIIEFLGYAYCLAFILISVVDIGRSALTLEKKRKVTLVEYIGMSFSFILYMFALPIQHSRIQKIIYDNQG